MLRIVKLTFREEECDTFLKHFESSKEKIRSFSGCISMNLLRDKKNSTIFFTYSNWGSEEDLEAYRLSETFKDVWKNVKPLFAKRAEAWSLETIG